jgi:molecular chaperone DnaK (HSP70)
MSAPCLAQGRRGAARGFGLSNQLHVAPGPGGMHGTPQDREAFRRNAERWLRMDAQQQQMLRERERMRQQQLNNEVDAAIKQSGLRLDQRQREEFQARYLQERRRIERELRQETESKRQQELPQLNERLKREFQSHQGNQSPTASPGK